MEQPDCRRLFFAENCAVIMKKRTIIFGAGGTAKKVLAALSDSIELIGYVDNDSSKWGTTVDGIFVYNPEILQFLFFEQVAIAVLKGVGTVRSQLISIGIPENMIIVPVTNPAVFFNDSISVGKKIYSEGISPSLLHSRAEILLRYWYMKRSQANSSKCELLSNQSDFRVIDKEIFILSSESEGKFYKNTPRQELFELSATDTYWKTSIFNERLSRLLSKLSLQTAMELLQSYSELVPHCSLVILYGENNTSTRGVRKSLAQSYSMVHSLTLVLEHNYQFFLSLSEELARTAGQISGHCSLEYLKEFDKLELTILFFSSDSSNLYQQIKDRLETLQQTITGVHLFASRDREQFDEFAEIVLSPSTFYFHSVRHELSVTDSFFDMLDEMKVALRKNNIPLSKVCVTSGSVLRAYGLKETDDIDLIMTSDFRELYGEGLVVVSDHVEVHKINELDVDDDTVITDTRCHFTYYGVKFVNLDILHKYRIKIGNRDARIIELFLKLTGRKAFTKLPHCI